MIVSIVALSDNASAVLIALVGGVIGAGVTLLVERQRRSHERELELTRQAGDGLLATRREAHEDRTQRLVARGVARMMKDEFESAARALQASLEHEEGKRSSFRAKDLYPYLRPATTPEDRKLVALRLDDGVWKDIALGESARARLLAFLSEPSYERPDSSQSIDTFDETHIAFNLAVIEAAAQALRESDLVKSEVNRGI